jgi:hypothetical protein
MMSRDKATTTAGSDFVDLASEKRAALRIFDAEFPPVMQACGLMAEVAEFEKIRDRQEQFERRARLPRTPEKAEEYNGAIRALGSGSGSMEKAIAAGLEANGKRAKLEAEAEVCRQAANSTVLVGMRWARENYAALVEKMNTFLQARIKEAVTAAELLPADCLTADQAIRAGEKVAAAYATVDGTSQLWRSILSALRVEKSIFDQRGFGGLELLRSVEFPERITPATRKAQPPRQLIAMVADNAVPGVFTSDFAKATDARLRIKGAEHGLLVGDGPRLDTSLTMAEQSQSPLQGLVVRQSHARRTPDGVAL